MQLLHNGKRFEAICNSVEGKELQTIGFHFDRSTSRWWTASAVLAKKYLAFADSRAQEMVRRHEQKIIFSQATDAEVNIPVPEGKKYLGFQKVGIMFAQGRRHTLIADEMGLGKTIQAIGLINTDPGLFGRILIIPPANLKINWSRELNRWLVDKRTIGLASTTDGLPRTDIVIINYDIVGKLRKEVEKVLWDLKVCDESHYLKNPAAQRTKAVLGSEYMGKQQKLPIESKQSLYLTGTPILNRPIELWPLLRATDPEGLGANFWYYAKRYCGAWKAPWGWDYSRSTNKEELQERLRSTLMIRRLKADVLKELPKKRRQIIILPCPPGVLGAVRAEKKFWDDNVSEIKKRSEAAQWIGDDESYARAASELRQLDTDEVFENLATLRKATGIAKIPVVTQFVEEALEQIDKVVVFAHHIDVIEGIYENFKNIGIRYHGRIKDQTERQSYIDRFVSDPKCRVGVFSIVMSQGFSLVPASYGLFAELHPTPGMMNQAEDRMHRIGQEMSCLFQHLVFDQSLDASTVEDLIEKQENIDAILD